VLTVDEGHRLQAAERARDEAVAVDAFDAESFAKLRG
jgi:hypothetical protein